MDHLLTINNLKVHFPTNYGIVRAVDKVSLFIKKGEILGLVGESGSGKSTVAFAIAGLYSPTSGKIEYLGEDIGVLSKKRSLRLKKEIQIVFQDPGTSINPKRNIKQILELPLKIHNQNKDYNNNDYLGRIVELLEMVQLSSGYLYKYPSMLGGGEKQMVAIARVLASNPSLVLLDEPTSALDVSIQAKIINTLIQLQKKYYFSYLFISHDLSLMRNVASRVAIMYLGKICEIAATPEFFKTPLHPYTQMLLSSIHVISDEEEALKPNKIIPKGEIPSPVNIPSGCAFHLRCHKKMDICVREDPSIVEVYKGHTVRCHLYTK